jgi:hypothetical protein
MYSSSPATGLPLTTATRGNLILSRKINDWATGKSSATVLPAKRKFEDEDTPEIWQLQLSHQSGKWWVSVGSDSPLSYLMELAFRCLNLKSPAQMSSITVFHENTLIQWSQTPLHSSVIKPGDTLRIESNITTPVYLGGRVDYLPINDHCLIKLYRSTSVRPDLCYWVPIYTHARLLSILIRYWLWSESNILADGTTASNIEVWIPFAQLEDNRRNCYSLETSERLTDVIQKFGRPGYVEGDHLFGEPNGLEGKYRIFLLLLIAGSYRKTERTLKIFLHDYRSPRQKQIEQRRKQSRMTRVTATYLFNLKCRFRQSSRCSRLSSTGHWHIISRAILA